MLLLEKAVQQKRGWEGGCKRILVME